MLQVDKLGSQIQVLNEMEGKVDFHGLGVPGPRQQYEHPTTPTTTPSSTKIPTSISSPSTVATRPDFNHQSYCSQLISDDMGELSIASPTSISETERMARRKVIQRSERDRDTKRRRDR